MAWFTPKKPWKIKPKDSVTQERQVNSNVTRIEVVKNGFETTKPDEPKTPYRFSNEYLSRKAAKKAERKAYDPKATINSYGEQYHMSDYYDDESYITPTRHSSWRAAPTRTIGFQQETKKDFAWSPTRWSTFSFYDNFAVTKDDNSNLFIKDPETYVTPTAQEIQNKLHVYSTSVINTVKELTRLFYFKMIDEQDYIDKAVMKKHSSDSAQDKIHFFEQAYEGYVPGFTPLEQAVNFYQKILDKQAIANAKGSISDPYSEVTRFEREDFSNPYLNNQLDLNPLSKEYKISILNKISLIGKLGQQFEVEKEMGEKEVENSPYYKKKTMRDYSEISKVDFYQRMLPTYKLKFLTKNLIIDVPVQTSEKKQKIILIVDYSGSMNDTAKQIWVNAILIDRLRYVSKGEAEIYFSFFVSDPEALKFIHLKNAEDVKNFWKKFSNRPNGGCTNMGRIVETISKEVKKGKHFFNLKHLDLSKEQPEILIVNDGQDSVGIKAFPYKVNAISLIQFSNELKNLCVATGGKQVGVDASNIITTYSKDKVETFTI